MGSKPFSEGMEKDQMEKPFSEDELEKGNQNGEVMPFSEVVLEKDNRNVEVMPFSEDKLEKGNQM